MGSFVCYRARCLAERKVVAIIRRTCDVYALRMEYTALVVVVSCVNRVVWQTRREPSEWSDRMSMDR